MDVSFESSDELLIGPDQTLEMHRKFVLDESFTDNENYQSIDSRNYKLIGMPFDGLSFEDARVVAVQDVADVAKLKGTAEYNFALILMGENSVRHENYHQALGLASADLSSEIGTAWRDFAKALDNEKGIGVESRKLPVSEALSSGIGGDEGVEIDGNAAGVPIEDDVGSKHMVVMAPYWLNGLHNKAGIDIANQLNRFILENKLFEDKEAIERLLSAQEAARKLGLAAVLEKIYLDDPHYKMNLAEPRKLVGGHLVRDKEGAYRPAAGGNPVLVDKGEALTVKSKGPEAYRGAMELALSKGWTAIELKGSPKMMADAWLEAKLLNLTVANYKPSEKDQERFAQRIAEMRKQRDVSASSPVQQAPEMVEVRPFVDELGQTQMARVTYTVTFEGRKDMSFDNAKDAASAFRDFSGASPVVIRSVTRADGVVRDSVVAGEDIRSRKGVNGKVLERLEDREFSEALGEVMEGVNAAVVIKEKDAPVALDGIHVGTIIAVDLEKGRMLQKNGRGHIWHDISKMQGVMPKVGEMAQIEYKKNLAYVKAREKNEREQEGGLDR